jgi:2-polyprenyl-3-methyl-5-hydroxy-6-metoxy-1,4-benzoquinol methylase
MVKSPVDKILCLLCGSRTANRSELKRNSWVYVRCAGCGALSLNTVPSEEALWSYYNHAYMVPATAYARGTRKSAPEILREVNARFPQKGKLLEVGCSYGVFLKTAQEQGWDATGIELDDVAAANAKEKLGLRVFAGSLEGEFARLEPPYDVVATFHVIEHVRNPLKFLHLCRCLLRDGGLLILKTPNVESWIAKKTGAYWQWLSPPAHLHLFSPKALVGALQRSGFRVKNISSRQGDAHNNLFELACAAGRYAASGKNGNANGHGRASWSDKWHVNTARIVSEVLYFPAGLLLDPWLGSRGLQPELLAIAEGCA